MAHPNDLSPVNLWDKLIANSINRQFTTSKLGKHSSWRRTRHVSKDVKRMSLEEAEPFTSAIKSCRSSRAYGPDSVSIFHLKNLGPLATEHLTTLYNDSLKSFRLPSIWKTSLVMPRIVRTGVPQGSKLSPSLFHYYIADMPRPAAPVKRVCYADDITFWATGPKIPQLESMINNYLREVSIYMKLAFDLCTEVNSHALHPKQTPVPDASRYYTQLPLERSPKILGVIMDPSISFHKHCNYVSDRIDKINNMLKALARSSWGQDKETLLLTYNALVKYIASYAAPVWSTNTRDSSFKKIQTAQNASLRTVTRAHKMASIDHLHQESLTLRVKDHSDMISAQYLVNCMEWVHVSHCITIQDPRPRPMKETLHSRHHSTVLPRLGSSRMESDQILHTHAIQLKGNNRVLKERPPPISDEEQRLNRRQRFTISQLRSGHCNLMQDYKHRVLGEPSNICRLWSFTTRCETSVRLHHTPD